MSIQNHRRLPELDGLRGLAALAVFVAHAQSEGLMGLGWATTGLGKFGVAVFYALSGYLMAKLYFERHFSPVELRSYSVARIARVLPLYYTAIAFAGAIILAGGPSIFGFDSLKLVAANVLLIRGNGILWSIPVEIQFYAIFVVLWFARSRRLLGAALFALCVLQGVAIAGLSSGNESTLPYWLHFFLIGIGVAVFGAPLDTLRGSRKAHALAAPVLGAGLLMVPSVRHLYAPYDLPVHFDPVAILAVVLLLGCCIVGAGPVRYLAAAPLQWLGARSFGLYLLHMPVICLAGPFFSAGAMDSGLAFCAVTILVLAAATISHNALEMPAMGLLRRSFGGTARPDRSVLPTSIRIDTAYRGSDRELAPAS